MEQLEKILQISAQDFFSEYHLQKHLFVPAQSPNAFDEALELRNIEVYLSSVSIRHGQITLINRNNRPWADQFLQFDGDHVADNTIDIHKLLGLLKNGTTAILNDLGEFIPKLKNYSERLENELGARLQANVYITPPKSQGFNPHIDSHDVFVLQLFGKKTWRLYEGMTPNPTRSLIRKQKAFDSEEHKLTSQIELSQGDLLYVPQGMYHDADTHEEPSVHITLGVLPRRKLELLKILADHARDHDFFRGHLQKDFHEESAKESFKKEFKEACHQLIEETDLEELLKEASRQFSVRQSPDLKGALFNTLQIERLTINSEVKRKPNIRYWLEEGAWFTTVHFYQQKVEVPKPIESVLEIVLGKESFRPKDISLDLSNKVKLDLVKKFISCGFLNIIEL